MIQAGNILQTNSNITGVLTDSLSPGTYTIRVLNGNNCSADTVVTIVPPIVITPTVSANAPTCSGGNDGSLSITATGGVSPYTYSIGTGTYSTASTFSNLSSGGYTLHVKDANLCVKDTAVTVPDALHTYFQTGIANPWCNFYSNGIISVSGYNSVPPYTYAIGTGAYSSAATFTNLNSGTYTVHVKNANGCINDTTITLADSLSVSAALTLTNVLCYGGSSGVINITPAGGFGAPYNYAINSGSYTSSGTFSNLTAGTYNLQVRDVNQCYFDTSVTLIQPSQIVITPTITNVTCYGNTNGSIVANTTGGTPTYSYTLNGVPQAGNGFSPLAAGQYIVQVTDQHSCAVQNTITVTQPNPLAISSVSVHNVSCNGGNDGSFTVNPTGGTTPYTYAVNAGAFSTSNVLGGLAAGSYAVHIKDANGCTKDTTMTLTEPSAISIGFSIKNSICHTLANGAITLAGAGGTPSYTYSNGSGVYTPSGSFTSLPGGIYTMHVKDANGCVQSVSITITDSIIVTGNFTITGPLCYSQSNGAIVVNGAGGKLPYTYAFTTGSYSTADTFNNIAAGTYVVHIKDGNGCIDDTTITVAQPGFISILPVITAPSCYGYSDGHVIVGISGGTPGYTYKLNSGGYSTLDSFHTLSAGNDTIYVKDTNGCIQNMTIVIPQPSPLKVLGLTITKVKCYGDTTGQIIVYAGGGASPYTYAADSLGYHTSDTLMKLRAGHQLVMVKDNNGCMADSAITITQPPKLALKVDSLYNPTCEGYKDGSIKLDGMGGTSPYIYNMNGAAYGTQHAWYKLGEGIDTFYVQDGNNCAYDTAITFTGYPHIIIDGVTVRNVACYGTRTGQIDVTATGGVQPLSYRLDAYGNSLKMGIFDSVKAGDYTIFITDSMQCKKDTVVNLIQPDSLHIVTTVSPNECVGYENMGAVTANVTGGTVPYTYLWNTTPANTDSLLTGMANGNYVVWVTDANACTDSAITAVTYDDCCKPYLPNAFTPNGDGRDDIFRIVFKGDLKLENFSVYNRFGQRVYNTIYIDKGWDGKYNGVPQDLGTYFYYVKALCGNKGDHEIVLEGNVTLIR